jgi:hypothetical protein
LELICFLPFLVSLALLSPSSKNENTREGNEGANDCDQPLDVFVDRDQNYPTDDRQGTKNKRKNLPVSFRLYVPLNNGLLKVLTMRRLSFGHRDDTLCAVGKNLVVLREDCRMWKWSLKAGPSDRNLLCGTRGRLIDRTSSRLGFCGMVLVL